ncbi:hypothetical protein B0T10DRAFT_557921 [Thelonectria olida]|uniref:Uncharacterized protein n=1 Tax=Thelonectria olida TaxID=1576542 RepID=A0A9P8WBW2_9HYPO|nr:hypothetical protein B0T10DRAFT_557921 [Thelonectria olida]
MKSVVTLSLVAAGLCVKFAAAVPGSEQLPARGPYGSSPSETLRRDVVVIGGGSSGAYAATKLQRMGKSVVVVERHDVFGGHTSSYHVPGTNKTIDYGVQGYGDEKVIREHFASFDIPLEQLPLSETSFGTSNYVDFRNGRVVPNFTFSTHLEDFKNQSIKYPYLYYSTRLPTPVPKDFLLPFRDFLAKYGLEDTAYNFYYNLEGFGDLLSQTTLYVLKYFNREYLAVLDPDYKGALVTARRYNQELYVKSQQLIGDNALVSSRALSATRNKHGVTVLVQTPNGLKTIAAKKLLVAMPPLLSNMVPLALDDSEHSLFSRFAAMGWYVGLVRASGLPAGFAYQNTRPDTLHNLPKLPALYQMSPTEVPDTYLVRYGSSTYLDDSVVKADIVRTFNRVRGAVLGKKANGLEPAELLVYSSHWPFNLHVSSEDIAKGFYNKLDDLQGYRNTWYTGAAIVSHATGALWNFTDHLVDRMYKD